MQRELNVLLSQHESRTVGLQRSIYVSVLKIVGMSSQRGVLQHCPFRRGGEQSIQSCSNYLHPLPWWWLPYRVPRKKGPDQPRTFCRKLALLPPRRNAPAKCSQRHAVRNYVCVSEGKQASTHSLKSSRLDLKCVLTSWGQTGTISLYELKPFVAVWDCSFVMATSSVLSWNKKMHYDSWKKKKKETHFEWMASSLCDPPYMTVCLWAGNINIQSFSKVSSSARTVLHMFFYFIYCSLFSFFNIICVYLTAPQTYVKITMLWMSWNLLLLDFFRQ